MVIRCPSCGRTGKFPHPFGLTAHTLRCRRCSALFVTVPTQVDGAELPALEHAPLAGSATDSGMFPLDDLAAREDSGFGALGDIIGDSHYELGAISDDVSDSQIDLPAFAADDLDWDEPQSAPQLNRDGVRRALGASGLVQIGPIEAWGRYHLYVALGFAAASLGVMGYFLLRPLVGGATVGSSTTALVVGCIGTIAFLLLSLAATTLNLRLVELARNVRQLARPANMISEAADERSRAAGAGFSRTAV
jgi:hypothetical protein